MEVHMDCLTKFKSTKVQKVKKSIKNKITKIQKYKKSKTQKYKKYKNTKNTWVPAMSTKKQNRKKWQKKHLHQLFPQNFKMMYRDSTKNQIKNRGHLLLRFGN